MSKRIVFRGIDHSPVLEEHINKQMEKIDHFLSNDRTPQFVDIILEGHPSHAINKFEIRIKTPSYEAIVSEEGQDINKLIDRVLDAAYLELRKQKEKHVQRDKHGVMQDLSQALEEQREHQKKK